MIKKNMWKIFETTGNVEAYLYVLQHDRLENNKKKAGEQLEALLPPERKINSM